MGSYYPILNFIHARCRAYSGAVDRALIDGQLRLREDGSVIDISIVEERTDAPSRLRRAAQRSVLGAEPFDPLPPGAGVKSILLPVIYGITQH